MGLIALIEPHYPKGGGGRSAALGRLQSVVAERSRLGKSAKADSYQSSGVSAHTGGGPFASRSIKP